MTNALEMTPEQIAQITAEELLMSNVEVLVVAQGSVEDILECMPLHINAEQEKALLYNHLNIAISISNIIGRMIEVAEEGSKETIH